MCSHYPLYILLLSDLPYTPGHFIINDYDKKLKKYCADYFKKIIRKFYWNFRIANNTQHSVIVSE
jgi:hypothetical protein